MDNGGEPKSRNIWQIMMVDYDGICRIMKWNMLDYDRICRFMTAVAESQNPDMMRFCLGWIFDNSACLGKIVLLKYWIYSFKDLLQVNNDVALSGFWLKLESGIIFSFLELSCNLLWFCVDGWLSVLTRTIILMIVQRRISHLMFINGKCTDA